MDAIAISPDLRKAAKPFGLTHNELDFCDHFLRCGNVTQAAILAGYAESTADKKGWAIVRKERVAKFLKDQIERRWNDERMEVPEILARLARLARFDARKLVNEDGTYKSLADLDESTAAGLRAFETDLILKEGGDIGLATRKYKFADTHAALRTLAQTAQLLSPEIGQVNVFINMGNRMDAARKRRLARRDEKVVSEQ